MKEKFKNPSLFFYVLLFIVFCAAGFIACTVPHVQSAIMPPAIMPPAAMPPAERPSVEPEPTMPQNAVQAEAAVMVEQPS